MSTLSSDNLPILIRLQMKTTTILGLRRSISTWRKLTGTDTGKKWMPHWANVLLQQRDEKIFRTVLLNAASHHIRTGRHRLHKEPVPAEIFITNRLAYFMIFIIYTCMLLYLLFINFIYTCIVFIFISYTCSLCYVFSSCWSMSTLISININILYLC